MIALIIAMLMIIETTFLEAQARPRTGKETVEYRINKMFPYTEEELDFINGKWS